MGDTPLDKIFYELQGITANQKRILELLSERSKEIAKVEITNTMTEEITGPTFAVPIGKKGKYQWYRLSNNDGKVRKCDNDGCDLFLKFDEKKETYEHWKYDVNDGKGFYVQDTCDFYGG